VRIVSDELPLPSRRFLTRTQAASYVGVSSRTFDAEVKNGLWPGPMRRGGRETALTWDRNLLDRAADRLGGMVAADSADASLAAAEQAALEAASRGTPAKGRNQHRHQKAA
jgi:predicted DNA-binding transcriptional regulator AlpA